MTTKKSLQNVSVLPYTLRAIYLRDSAVRMDNSFDPILPGQQLAPIFRTGEGRVDCRETTISSDGNETIIHSCAFTTRFDFAYTKMTEGASDTSDEDIEKTIAAQITADITVDYLINSPDFPDPENLKGWASSHVILHAWPYWREFCHSTMLRMNLPVTMIPLVQVAVVPEPVGKMRAENNSAAPKRANKKANKTL